MSMSSIWAIADLHLAKSIPEKSMDVFGPEWHDYMHRIEKEWKERVQPHDLVLLPGDISWAMRLDAAKPDFDWIDHLPGPKVMIRGNHDYWWSSPKKMRENLPPSIHIIQNDHFDWEDTTIGGTRLWDPPDISFASLFKKNEAPSPQPCQEEEQERDKIYRRELIRLEQSLQSLNPNASRRMVMTHYPPIGPQGEATPASDLLEKYRIDICLFGHLHGLLPQATPPFGHFRGIDYHLVAADYLNFTPKMIVESGF